MYTCLEMEYYEDVLEKENNYEKHNDTWNM